MKDKSRKLNRQAYMDEQLSVEEVIEFEKGLNRGDKVEIEDEKKFEDTLISFLAKDAECPDELWNEVKARVALHSNSWLSIVRYKFFKTRFFKIAAVFIALITLGMIVTLSTKIPLTSLVLENRNFQETNFNQLKEVNEQPIRLATNKIPVKFSDNLSEFSRPKIIEGDFGEIRTNLINHGFDIGLNQPKPDGKHTIELLGLRYITIDDEEIAQLYFSCCTKPVTVLLSRNSHGDADNFLQVENSFRTLYNARSKVGDHQIFILGPHPPTHILDLFT